MSEANRAGGPLEQPRRWPALVERMIDLAVLPEDRQDLVRTKRLFTAAMWASLLISAVSVFQFYNVDASWAALTVTVPILFAAISLFAMWRRPKSYPGVMHLVTGSTLFVTATMIIILGGIFEAAGNTLWALLVVVSGAPVFGDRRAHFWLAVFVVTTIAAYVVSQQVEPLLVLPGRGYFTIYNVIIVTAFLYFILYYFVRQSDHLYEESEGLLRNILPDEIVQRLKLSDEMIADRYESASILFADVAGFTPVAAELSPEDVIDLLNQVFTSFDVMVAELDLEKIKTIGDAYMVSSGVPVERDDHAEAICDLALAMRDHLATHTFSGRRLQMRIGIASGPVMAGIIGVQKFSYDLWGDTVNLASRMETTGTPGMIQLAAATRDLVAESFTCVSRGTIDVKGKGPMETWYLEGRAPLR